MQALLEGSLQSFEVCVQEKNKQVCDLGKPIAGEIDPDEH